MEEIEQEIDLDQITDENLLQSLLDQTDDPEDRKVIRDRIKELRSQKAAKKVERDEKLTRLTNTREDMLQQKKKEAEQHKQRTMAMYDNMARSAPAGGDKKLDTNILKQDTKPTSPTPRTTTSALPTTPRTPTSPGSFPLSIGPKVDLVEDAIKRRQREAEERKKRILAAYDVAAKTQPAGTVKEVDFDVVNKIDVSQYEIPKNTSNVGTFQMSGGVPIVKKTPSVPASPVIDALAPKFPAAAEEKLDAYERALRERQRECEERKRRLLESYQQISRCEAGPKTFVPPPNIGM
ncbi:uncharacterized protein LOC113794200 [Dermatophagoides pteronyssinus]|uniref:Uncharacterized protein LOC113794200 n=1 Tax=Dermatophagoides pteronyssinus TaxID=6956 RepID=A0A6P6Y4B2_DERPT|nr:uncharacterized protein LOC113794200 [Dermatophagoides pteronyssinus]XP_027200100.1 uncharacterized protein LOC113794200 [Dermatophagoides pteronyssinus]